MSTAVRLAREAQEVFKQADSENRPLSSDERTYVQGLLDRAKQHHAAEGQLKDLGLALGGMGNVFTDPRMGPAAGGDPGGAFVSSEGYRRIKSSGARGQSWSSGAIDVGLLGKANLFEGVGGTLVPPDYQPGVVNTLFQPLGLADYFKQVQTPSTQVRYVVEGTATSGAAGVAEGGTKPESTLAYSEVVEQVRKVATSLPVSDELLEDAVGIQTYISGRLAMFVRIEEERQLLRGAGSGSNELLGIFGRSISTTSAGTSNADRIFRAAAGVRGSAFVDPDLVVIHPSNWTTARLAQDAAGQYYGGGPWSGQYGATGGAQVSSFSSSPYWGMRVFVSTHVGAGTALIGNASESACIFRRGGLSVEATSSHSDFFVKDLSMLRAEQREALAVFRPSAWVSVTGLT